MTQRARKTTRQQMRGKPLTDNERAVMRAIVRHLRQHGIPPSLRELQTALDLAYMSLLVNRLQSLEERGLIQRAPRKARSVRVIGALEPWEDA